MTPKTCSAWAPWLAAAAGLALTLGVFYPGYMSWDSAYQWWQARHGQYDTTQPPLMSLVWRWVDAFGPGPGGMFVLQASLIWAALAAFAAVLPGNPFWRALLVLLVGFWPPLFGLLPHLWKDLWMLAAFAWTIVFLVLELRHSHRRWRLGAWLALVVGCAFRYNAIFGALPLLLWLAWRERAAGGAREFTRWPFWLLAAGLTLATWVGAQLPNQAATRKVERVWSVVTLWDAAAVSLQENRLIYPPSLIDPALTLEELRAHFTDYSNTTVFEIGKIRHTLDGPYTSEQQAALRQLAWDLPLRHPRAYFLHRLRLAELLFGWDQANLPEHQVVAPGWVHYGDNPAIEAQRSSLNTYVQAWLMRCIDTPLFAGGWYLLIATGLTAIGIKQARRQPWSGLSAATAASALAYALPLVFISGSAEFRYLAWPILAAGLASVLAMAARKQQWPRTAAIADLPQ